MARKADAAKPPEHGGIPEHIPCAHETCDHSARVKVLTATGWAKLCLPHYVMHFDGLARKRCTELGLDLLPSETREQHRKRMLFYLRGTAKLKTFADAEAREGEWAA